jgi:hypothetical protein
VESAKANGTNNHGLDGDRLFVGVLCTPRSLAVLAERQPTIVAICVQCCLPVSLCMGSNRLLHCYARQRSREQGGDGEAHSVPCQGQDRHDPQAAVAPDGELFMYKRKWPAFNIGLTAYIAVCLHGLLFGSYRLTLLQVTLREAEQGAFMPRRVTRMVRPLLERSPRRRHTTGMASPPCAVSL